MKRLYSNVHITTHNTPKGYWKNSLKIGHVTNTHIGGMYAFTMSSHDPWNRLTRFAMDLETGFGFAEFAAVGTTEFTRNI